MKAMDGPNHSFLVTVPEVPQSEYGQMTHSDVLRQHLFGLNYNTMKRGTIIYLLVPNGVIALCL